MRILNYILKSRFISHHAKTNSNNFEKMLIYGFRFGIGIAIAYKIIKELKNLPKYTKSNYDDYMSIKHQIDYENTKFKSNHE